MADMKCYVADQPLHYLLKELSAVTGCTENDHSSSQWDLQILLYTRAKKRFLWKYSH